MTDKFYSIFCCFVFLFSARNVDITRLPFCSKGSLPAIGECNPQDWMSSYKIRDEKRTWWLKDEDCKLDKGSKQVCPKWKHLYNSMICYVVRCP